MKLVALLLVVIPSLALAQFRLGGTIFDKATHLPIGYCNIGIPEKGIGTVCNAQGKFELVIPGDLAGATIMVSHIGYERLPVVVSELAKKPAGSVLELQPSPIKLPEVAIRASQQVSLGHRPNDNAVKGFFKASGLGMEGGTLIRNTAPAVLTSFNMNILKVPFDSMKFRLNIYDVKKQRPATRLNEQDLVFSITSADTGVFSLPLGNEGIQVAGDFICTIELIELFGQPAENAVFLFSALPDADGLIYKRAVSMDKWERVKKYSLCFWLTGRK